MNFKEGDLLIVRSIYAKQYRGIFFTFCNPSDGVWIRIVDATGIIIYTRRYHFDRA